MAVLTHSYQINRARSTFVNHWNEVVDRLRPRRCMLVSAGLILAGLSIPLLMTVKLLPLTLALGLVGFALSVTGGVLALILCGEL